MIATDRQLSPLSLLYRLIGYSCCLFLSLLASFEEEALIEVEMELVIRGKGREGEEGVSGDSSTERFPTKTGFISISMKILLLLSNK